MTDKTVSSSSKSSSKSSSSSLALEKQRPPKVLLTFLSLSLSLSARGWWCENKVDFHKSPQSLAFFFSRVARVWGTNDVAINQRKERTNRKQRDSRDFRKTDTCRGDANEKRQHVSRKKAKQKNFSRFFSLSLSPEFCLVRCCVWEKIRILFN